MNDGLVKILDGNTFVVSDSRGDIEASLTDPTGLFSFDSRFLSTWILTVDGQKLNPLSVDDLQYFESRFFLVPGTGTVYVDAKLSVIRRRAVGDGFHEELTILNHDAKPVELTVRVEGASDFADLFEVKDALKKKGKYSATADKGQLLLTYERDTYKRQTAISASAPARIDERGLTFEVRVAGHGSWTTDLDVVTAAGPGGTRTRPKYERGERRARPNMERSLDRWLADAPRLESDSDSLKATYRRSLVDLAALRFSPPVVGGGKSLPAAGLPWFMTMFGRDSIFTSLQALPFTPELAATTLKALGAWQGTRIDDFRDEDPGRILHEMRYGEMTAFEERPHSPYYGNADATALYVVLLDEYERWTGDRKLVRDLEDEARAALRWIDEYADLMGNGYVSYQRRNEKPVSRTSAGRTPGTRSRTTTGACPASRGRLASCRAMPTTRRSVVPASHGWSGRIQRSLRRSRTRQPTSSAASTAISGSKTESSSPSRSTTRESRSTPSPRTTAICSGAGSSTSRRRKRSSATSWARGSSPAGASARSPRAKVGTTPSATTSAPSGRSTAPSSPGACGNTASSKRRLRSLPESSTRPSSSMDAFRRHSAATSAD